MVVDDGPAINIVVEILACVTTTGLAVVRLFVYRRLEILKFMGTEYEGILAHRPHIAVTLTKCADATRTAM